MLLIMHVCFSQDDNDYSKNQSGMLAIFEPSGHGTCYFRSGDVRYVQYRIAAIQCVKQPDIPYPVLELINEY